ncbi:hypothetical protein EON80_12905 [bacterium]|nr:MAG: hypothetical protein EON80_12905 [bacterium]
MKFRLASLFARSLSHLAVIAMMMLAFAPQSSEFWQCEGRPCGPTAWTCCCVLPTDNHDAECAPTLTGDHFQTSSHIQEIGNCPADCHCSVVSQSVDRSVATTSHLLISPEIVLATAVFIPTPEFAVSPDITFPLESRGPPQNATYLAQPSLRGPPLA